MRGDERIRTAVPAPSDDGVYEWVARLLAVDLADVLGIRDPRILLAEYERRAETGERGRRLAAQREDIERLATRVETAEAEVERLRSDKDERDWRTLEIVTKQAEAAEAECARLRQAAEYAEGVLSRDPFDDVQRKHAADVLRDALAGPDTPADSQPEETTT